VGWHRKALEMCGAANVRVEELECRAKGAAVCRYRVAWD
jgi:predicted hydrocarbon binding protein